MQKLKAFSIYDVKAEVYSPPFFLMTNGLAVRQFEQLANDLQTTIGQHPADFTLFEIGHFDDASGTLVNLQANNPLGAGIDFVHRDPADQWLKPETNGSQDPTNPDLPQ